MELTTYLAQLWGPVLLAVGVGFFASRSYYVKVYRDIEKAPFAVLFFGMFAVALGTAHVLAHNVWGSLAETVVTLLGWGLLLKGVICTAFPRFADRSADWAVNVKVVPAAGAIALLIGAYLTWLGYFM